ncbi:hypothetical protein AVEN_15319-1 [Araneus ventricosus]|uniref:Uncharacterized protein n=1 Tax=Araneus ventricosus TaxID=182803 RepID=A0A4Y2JHW8_ARAVE|nr:hypothetical protein AVEN_15319-1 [Araneus ventricosus]
MNPLTPKPTVAGHATSILVGRISGGGCSEWREKAVGRVIIKDPLWVEIEDERPAIHISHHPGEKISKQTSVYNCTQILRNLSSKRVNGGNRKT